MPNYVSKFNLNGTDIEVKDATARATADAAKSAAEANTADITELKGKASITLTYDSTTETINVVTA